MIHKGKIAAINSNKVKVVYEENNIMTPYIDVAAHVTDLALGQTVLVAVLNNNLKTGVVIGVIL